jgi:hypothetical protein
MFNNQILASTVFDTCALKIRTDNNHHQAICCKLLLLYKNNFFLSSFFYRKVVIKPMVKVVKDFEMYNMADWITIHFKPDSLKTKALPGKVNCISPRSMKMTCRDFFLFLQVVIITHNTANK